MKYVKIRYVSRLNYLVEHVKCEVLHAVREHKQL